MEEQKVNNTEKVEENKVDKTQENKINSDTKPPQEPPAQARGQLSIFKIIFFYFVMNQVISFFFQGNQKSNPNLFVNVFSDNEPLELRFIISKKLYVYENNDSNKILRNWTEKGIFYNYESTNYRENVIYFNKSEIENLKNLYVHLFIYSISNNTNYSNPEILSYKMLHKTFDLFEIKEKLEKKEEKNLLFETNDEKPIEPPKPKKKGEMKPHLRTKNYISLVHDTNYYAKNQIPPQINLTLIDHLKIYQPIIDTKSFWSRKKDFTCVDDFEDNVNVTFSFNLYWSWKYMMEVQMASSNEMHESWGMDSNMDEIKEMILDTNVYLVTITMIVSLLHSVFEFLAIKNDIQFWRSIESHKGLSLRTLYINFIVEIIVFLYLFDNETSTIIIVTSGIEILVTIWKIMKTTKFKWRTDGKFPFVQFDHRESYKGETEIYDKEASKYLFWIMIPLFAGYVIYSLIYEKYKGWYSFFLHTSVGFIYVFGFIQMTPQLYINYKLKSVEHLPWRTMIYKFLNTIVDDLFAFVITMPWLKRLSCFRDDIIFVIYLYQRWAYRVDKRRTEYGFTNTKENENIKTEIKNNAVENKENSDGKNKKE